MSNNYQAKNSPWYIADHNLYMQTAYMIRGYRGLRRRRDEALHASPPPPDGMPRGGAAGDPTARRALLLAALNAQIEAIERVSIELRGKYRKTCTGEPFDPYEAFLNYGVFCYYRSKKGRETAPCYKTWKRFRAEFIYKVAQNMNQL
jgi:hypothetical protein